MKPSSVTGIPTVPSQDSLLRGEIARLLYGGLPSSLMANAFLAMLLVFVQWSILDAFLVAGWSTLFAVVLAFRLWTAMAYKKASPDIGLTGDRFLYRFRFGAMATGAVWGLHGLALFPADALAHQVFLAFVLASVSSGAITSLAADRPSALGFVFLAVLPLLPQLILANNTITLTMSIMVVLFLVFVTASSSRLQHQLHENIRLRNESATQEVHLQHQQLLNQLIARAQSDFIRETDRRKAFDGFLQDFLALTDSEYGFIGEVLHTPQGAPYLKTYAITNIAWNEATRSFYEANAPQGMEFGNLNTLFGAVMTSGKPVIANDPCHDPRRGGLPDGHPALNAFLGLPIYHGNTLVAMVGISNRPGGYDQALVDFLHPLLVTLGQLVVAARNQQQHIESRKELNQFKRTLDRTLDCVFMFDASSLKFFYVNEGALRQVGFSRDELLKMHPFDIKPDISESQFQDLIAPLLSGEKDALTFETTHQHKSGQRIPVEIFLQYIAPNDEPPRFVAIVRDITERKRIERMKSEFVSTVSHELRTPLTSITGALGLLTGGPLGPLSGKAGELVSIAHKNSLRLSLLINDLLDMEKLAAGKMNVELTPQKLTPLLEQAIEANQVYGIERQVAVTLCDEVPDAVVNADGHRLMQVLSNLLSNAIKYSPDRGSVEVAVSKLDGAVRVTVSDHGPGIPAEFHDRIFQKFAQADSSDTRQKGGTGLGLAISRELIEHMGGRIGFESVENAGARFYFELPLHDQVNPDPAPNVVRA